MRGMGRRGALVVGRATRPTAMGSQLGGRSCGRRVNRGAPGREIRRKRSTRGGSRGGWRINPAAIARSGRQSRGGLDHEGAGVVTGCGGAESLSCESRMRRRGRMSEQGRCGGASRARDSGTGRERAKLFLTSSDSLSLPFLRFASLIVSSRVRAL
jgi:hypothetical protein